MSNLPQPLDDFEKELASLVPKGNQLDPVQLAYDAGIEAGSKQTSASSNAWSFNTTWMVASSVMSSAASVVITLVVILPWATPKGGTIDRDSLAMPTPSRPSSAPETPNDPIPAGPTTNETPLQNLPNNLVAENEGPSTAPSRVITYVGRAAQLQEFQSALEQRPAFLRSKTEDSTEKQKRTRYWDERRSL